MKKDTCDLSKLVHGIESRMNPFAIEADDDLYCLTTGKSITQDIKADLLHSEKIGNTWCQEYTEACFKDPANFEKPIQRRKIKNFFHQQL